MAQPLPSEPPAGTHWSWSEQCAASSPPPGQSSAPRRRPAAHRRPAPAAGPAGPWARLQGKEVMGRSGTGLEGLRPGGWGRARAGSLAGGRQAAGVRMAVRPGQLTLTGGRLLAAAVARHGGQVCIIQEGSGEHQGEQVEEVVIASDDNQDLQQDLGGAGLRACRRRPLPGPFRAYFQAPRHHPPRPAPPRSLLQARVPSSSPHADLCFPTPPVLPLGSQLPRLPTTTWRKPKLGTPRAAALRHLPLLTQDGHPPARLQPRPTGIPSTSG